VKKFESTERIDYYNDSLLSFAISLAYAQQPQDVYDLKLEGAKFPPVKFNHDKT